MKLIMRIDDVGYTHVHNLASFAAIDEGIATSADLMLDTPGAVEAMEFLRERTWISVGWHMHFWGSPVLSAEQVPTLVRENGHFRKDVSSAEDISEAEAYAELRAEIIRCIKVLGRAPDYTVFGARPITPFGRATARVLEEFHIPSNFVRERMGEVEFPPEANAPKMNFPMPGGENKEMPKMALFPGREVDPKWVNRKIWGTGITSDVFLMTDSVTELYENYNPLEFYLKDYAGLLKLPEDVTVMTYLHPGFVDYYVYKEGDYGSGAKNFMVSRTMDYQTVVSPEMKQWIRDNKVELVSTTDALYGTNDYQNHLKAVESDLAV